MEEQRKMNINSQALEDLRQAFAKAKLAAMGLSDSLAKLAAMGLSDSLAKGTLVEDMQRHLENERWRNDPLQLKKRFLDPVPAFVAGRLRAIADKLDPAPARGKNCGSTYIPRIK
jgi:hypothetical protein